MNCEQNNTLKPVEKPEEPQPHREFEIHWGGKVFRFKTIEEARTAAGALAALENRYLAGGIRPLCGRGFPYL